MERRRKGSIFRVFRNGREYWEAAICIDYRIRCKVSKDRGVVERWLEGMLTEHPTYELHPPVVRSHRVATRRRKGFIVAVERNGRPYYRGSVSIDYVRHGRCSRDRAVVEAWLAGMLAEHPTYEVVWGVCRRPVRAEAPKPEQMPAPSPLESLPPCPVPTSNPFAGRRRASVAETPSLWMVAAETNPNTSLMLMRNFGRRPARVLVTDIIEGTPIVWVADDNGGEGFGSEAAARERMRAMAGSTDPSVMLSVRPLSRRRGNDGTF